MDKRALRKVPFFRPKEVDFIFNSTEESAIRTVANCFTTIVKHNRILVVDLYMRDKVYRHFIGKNKGEFEYITLNLQTNNWISSDISFLYYQEKPYNIRSYVVSKDTTAILNKDKVVSYLGLDSVNNVISALERVESKIKYDNKERKKAEEQKKINKFMEKFPKLTKNQIDFLKGNKAYFGFFNGNNVYCTHCGKEHTVDTKPKAKSKIICPHCDATIQLFSTRNRSKRSCYDRFIISNVKGIPVLRHFKVYQKFGNDYRNPTYSYREFARDIVYKGKLYKTTLLEDGTQWFKGRVYDVGCCSQYNWGQLYRNNLDSVLKGTELEYCALQYCPDEELKWDWYIQAYLKYPMLEALLKSGCYNIVYTIVNSYQEIARKQYYGGYYCKKLNPLAKTPYDFIGVNKFEYKKIAEYDLSFTQAEDYKIIARSGFSMLWEDVMLLLTLSRGYGSYLEKFFSNCKDLHLTPHKVIKYLIGQETSTDNFFNVFSYWKDYIDCCKDINIDLRKFATPKNLKKEHDRVFALKKAHEDAITRENFKNFFNDTLQFIENVECDGYVFRVLSSFDDFVNQGNILHQCVGKGGYYASTSKRKKFIVSIADCNKPAIPLYTLEVENGQNAQCRGYKNAKVPAKVNNAINLYLADINKKLNYSDEGISLRCSA